MGVRRRLLYACVCWGLSVCMAALWSEAVRFEGQNGSHEQSATSPDGKVQAKVSHFNTITLWDVGAGAERWSLKDTKSGIYSLVFSPDGKTLATGSDPIKILDVATGEERSILRGQGGFIRSIAFSPDGRTLASGDVSLWLWDVATGQRRYLEEPRWMGETSVDFPDYVAFSPDGKTLASIVDERVGLWDVASGEHTATLDRGFRRITLTTDGKFVVLLENDKTVKISELSPARTKCVGALFILGAAILLFLPLRGRIRAIARTRMATRVKTAEGEPAQR